MYEGWSGTEAKDDTTPLLAHGSQVWADKMKMHIRIMILTAIEMLTSTHALAANMTDCGATYLNLLEGSGQLHAELKFEPPLGSTSNVPFRLYGNKVGRYTCDNGSLKSFEISGDDTSHGTFKDIDEFNQSVVIALFAAGLDAKDAIKTAKELQEGARHASIEDGSFAMPLNNGCKATLRIWLPNRHVSIVCG